jgi:hypothetical protein
MNPRVDVASTKRRLFVDKASMDVDAEGSQGERRRTPAASAGASTMKCWRTFRRRTIEVDIDAELAYVNPCAARCPGRGRC